MNNPLVSIVTVSFNAEKTIEQTIKSVLNQTYSNIEYIIIDGASTDNTPNIIEKYKDKLAFYVSEPDKGIYNAMNKGISHAHGTLIGIVNADDFYEHNAVEINVENYNAQGDNRDNTCYYGMLRVWKDEKEFCVRQYHHNFVIETAIQHPTCFVPRKLYERLGLFDESFRVCADFDLLNRFNSNGVRFCKIDRVISNFRIGGATTKLADSVVLEPYTVKLRYGIISQKQYDDFVKWLKIRNVKRKVKRILLFWK